MTRRNGVACIGQLCTRLPCLQKYLDTNHRKNFSGEREDGNLMDPYAVAIKRGSKVIGHVPWKTSAAYSLFMQRRGAVTYMFIDNHHQYSSDLPQGDLQIPYQLVFQSEDMELIAKLKNIMQSAPPIGLKPAKIMID